MRNEYRHPIHKPRPKPSNAPMVVTYARNGMRQFVSGVGTVADGIFIQGIKNYGRNYVFSAIAQIPGPIGAIASWARYKRFDSVNIFGPDVRKELLSSFSLSYSASHSKPGFEIIDKYNACVNERLSNIDGFADIKMHDNSNLSAKLADRTDAKVIAIVDSINNALQKPTDLQQSLKKINALKKIAQSPKSGQNPPALAATIREYHEQTSSALNTQLNAEKANIQALFKDATFVQNLKDTIGPGTTDKHIEQVEQDMLKNLEDTHKKATASVSDPKQIPDILDKMDKDAKRAADELFLISLLYVQGSTKMRALIQAQAEKEQYLTIGQSDEDEQTQSELKGVTLNKLPTIETLTGLTLQHEPGSNQFSLQVPPFWHWYHQSPDESVLEDMMLIALAVKTQGHEQIVMTVDHDNKDDTLRMEFARKAFEACRLMGWPTDKIVIKVNNEEMNYGKLFAGLAETLQGIEAKAAEWENQRQQDAEAMKKETMDYYKAQVFNQTTAEEKAAATGVSPPLVPPAKS